MWLKLGGILACALLVQFSCFAECTKLPEPGTCGVDFADRIYGGTITKPKNYPWTALLVFSYGFYKDLYWCGGSLISDRYVMTAAHCVSDLSDEYKLEKIRLGEWDLASDDDCDEQTICNDPVIDVEVEKVIMHENYTKGTFLNDIALIKLKDAVTFSEFALPLCLPTADAVKDKNTDELTYTAVGWGNTEHQNKTIQYGSRYKLHVQLNGVTNDDCGKVYDNIVPSKLCAGAEAGKDTCQGDSGGSLVAAVDGYSYAYGVVSYGKGCGRGGVPGVYTRVTSFLDWIDDHME
ncbi:transmembrane protease [Culex quinquefasciatus]|uniref:Transmembrane protease n=1 Tax=Culex quinquefasciatus TaxID=7176 RepID=B0WJK0_CULQU|nr:transmembrane protease [Culex quinquefasciatus]|eukprot:XP_001848884.1 transmembrane protease [Culex quinquefasciatus]